MTVISEAFRSASALAPDVEDGEFIVVPGCSTVRSGHVTGVDGTRVTVAVSDPHNPSDQREFAVPMGDIDTCKNPLCGSLVVLGQSSLGPSKYRRRFCCGGCADHDEVVAGNLGGAL
ncbi:hypothetical protein C478_07352 [Natrinema thermotolerans DSM 11552]|nr:hypothetical protein C478_07352 [Natrinema thermotolerans DSM 11552]